MGVFQTDSSMLISNNDTEFLIQTPFQKANFSIIKRLQRNCWVRSMLIMINSDLDTLKSSSKPVFLVLLKKCEMIDFPQFLSVFKPLFELKPKKLFSFIDYKRENPPESSNPISDLIFLLK